MDFVETSKDPLSLRNQTVQAEELLGVTTKQGIGVYKRVSEYKGRILIMDDDEAIRITLTRLLSRLNFDVVAVSDGVIAIEQYWQAKNSPYPFSLVILDMTVPGGMGGLATLQNLLVLDKEVKAIMSSGYSGESSISNYSAYGFVDVLLKPYGLRELMAVLQRVLEK